MYEPLMIQTAHLKTNNYTPANCLFLLIIVNGVINPPFPAIHRYLFFIAQLAVAICSLTL
jgi:hypothetical protein